MTGPNGKEPFEGFFTLVGIMDHMHTYITPNTCSPYHLGQSSVHPDEGKSVGCSFKLIQ